MEEQLSNAFEEKKRMETLLADPETYKDRSQFEDLMQDYTRIEKEVNQLTAYWEDSILKMETIEE